jgi:selenocysteine lyase/cysteine desulfurase
VIKQIGVEAIHEHDVALANRFRAGVGLDASDSAIVCADLPGAAERLHRAGIIAAVRGGLLRSSWHLYNDDSDVDKVLDVILP